MADNQNIQMNEEGFPDWEPVSFYDAPATILTQLYDGEGSLGRAVRTLMDQSSLSPKERDSYVQRIKKSHGGNPLVDTTIDIALNPLTWFLVLTSPITAKQFKRTGGKMLGGVSEMGKVGRMFVDALRGVHALGTAFMNEHAVTSQAINHMANRQNEIQEKLQEIGGKARGRMLANLSEAVGEEVLDFDHTRFSGEKGRKVGLLNRLLSAAAGGFFADDEVATHLLVDLPRIATVKGNKGEAVVEILPPMPKGQGARLYEKGNLVNFRDGRGPMTILDEPLVVNSEETYLEGKKLLGRSFNHLTIAEVPITFESRLPITRQEAMEMLAEEGFDTAIVQEYLGSVRQQQQYLAGLSMGKTANGELLLRGGKIQADPDKLLHAIQYMKDQSGVRQHFSQAEQDSFHELFGSVTENILPDWVQQGVRRGTITETQLKEVVTKLYEAQINNPHYSPRSLANLWSRDQNMARRHEPYDVARITPSNAEDAMRVRSMMMLRERPDVMLDHGDLLALMDNFKGRITAEQQKQWEGLINRTDAYINSQIQTNSIAATLPLDFERSGRTYEQKMIGQAIAYGDAVPEFLREELKKVKVKPSRLIQGKDATVMELKEPDAIRKKTLNMLGLSGRTLENIEFGDKSYPVDLSFSFAALEHRREISRINELMTTTSDPRALSALERKRRRLSDEVDFIVHYRQPFASTQEPRSMMEFMTMLMPRENRHTREMVDNFIMPRMFGGAQGKHSVALAALTATRAAAEKFVNSPVGSILRDNAGKLGQRLFEGAQAFADRPIYIQDAANLSRNTAGYLYSTHLSSIMTGIYNAMQPFMWGASIVGVPEILKAYPKAWKQMAAYERERLQYGLTMDPALRRELFRKHVPLSNYHGRDLTMLNEDFLSTLDSAIFSGRVQKKPGLMRTIFMDLPLKFFQKVEEMNRIVMAEAGVSFNEKMRNESGTALTPLEIADNVQSLQAIGNFAPQMTTKPRMLADPTTGMGFLANPTMGMLVQYPVRFGTTIATSGMVYGGKRSFGLQKFGGPEFMEIPAQIADIGRVLGISAVMYEIGKNLMGINLSPGLGAQSVVGVVDTFGKGFIPVPVDISLGIVKGIFDDDREELRRSVFRLVPAGIPLSKALGSLPAIPGGGPFGLIQSQYADWKNPNEQGQIPVYKDDGTLQSFESPLALVMRGVGFNPQKFQSPQEATKFLLANRKQIIELKRQYKDAVLANNFSRASSIEAEYRTRFGVSMTVKPNEWDDAIKLREVGVGERLVDTMPQDVRGQYQQSLGQVMAGSMGLPEGGLGMGDSARQRSAIRQFSSGLSAPPEDTGS